MHIIYILIGLGLLLITIGVFISKYPKEARYLTLREFNLESIAENKFIRLILLPITKNKSFILNKISLATIKGSETNISLQAFYLVKIFCCILVTTVMLLINYTNLDITKVNIISKAGGNIDVFETANEAKSDNDYNYSLYYSVLKKVNEDSSFKQINDEQKRQVVARALPEIIHSANSADINYNVEKFLTTYYAVEKIRLLDWKVLLTAILAFFLPEILLLFKQLLLGSIYRKEVIKLENIFELLGSIEEFKTIDILEQMENASKLYKKQMKECRALFQTDRKLSIKTIKAATKNKKMSELIDVIRMYSLVDKKLAMDILAKNRKSRNEGILITADEDMDWIDIVAFLSITPLLYELANLLMKPMLDMIFDAFKYI